MWKIPPNVYQKQYDIVSRVILLTKNLDDSHKQLIEDDIFPILSVLFWIF